MIIDTHAHLDCFDDSGLIISSMKADNLQTIITVATNMQDSFWTVKTAEENEDVYASVGVHPSYANEIFTDNDFLALKALASNSKVVAIGESGLDYHYDGADKLKQRELFEKMIDLAYACALPLIVHSRDATFDLIEILKANKGKLSNGVVIHCFSGSPETAKELVSMGFYLSFSGSITYKKTNREILKAIPINKILVETDSPFLPPEPLRGTKNIPKNVNIIAQKIADTLEMNIDLFIAQTTMNAKKLFNKIK